MYVCKVNCVCGEKKLAHVLIYLEFLGENVGMELENRNKGQSQVSVSQPEK